MDEIEIPSAAMLRDSLRERIVRLEEEKRAYRKLAHEQGVRSGWLSPANGSSWSVLDKAAATLMEPAR